MYSDDEHKDGEEERDDEETEEESDEKETIRKDEQGNDLFVVEKILAKRIDPLSKNSKTGAVLEFHVQWKGGEKTWEPMASLRSCGKVLEEFNNNDKRKKEKQEQKEKDTKKNNLQQKEKQEKNTQTR